MWPGTWRSATTWFAILAIVCILGPYLLRVPPRTGRERQWLAITLAFLAWILLCMVSLR
jgi:hypothetical protein